jgi:hypothetical protein
LEADLFPPTFDWRLPSARFYEVIARRASAFNTILSTASGKDAPDEIAPPLSVSELNLPNQPTWTDVPITKMILLPGGRFLIVLGESQPIRVYDLALYYMDGTPPALLLSHELSHNFSGHHIVASTLAGKDVSCVRLAVPECVSGEDKEAGGLE